MQMERRHSYGVIPVIGTPEAWKLLLIDQVDAKLEHFWTFPKGTPEQGESPLETAVRETFEEVGIRCDKVDDQISFTNAYTFEQEGVRFEKSVTYFVGRAPSEVFKIQELEVRDACWCTLEEARALITFKDRSDIFDALKESGVAERLLM